MTPSARPAAARRPIGVTLIAVLLCAGLTWLGLWQVQRLAWKQDLIASIAARVHAPPVPAPRASDAEYLRVTASGHFRHDATTLVRASTVRGPGYWVMTPLATDRGFTIIVNRGFIPAAGARYARPGGGVRVTGLLRLTEPEGGFLRANDPVAGKWYSRDVAALARARGLEDVTPYFIDAQAGADPLLIGGLTVLAFPNNHLVYALTWFALAAMVAGATAMLWRQEWIARRP
ncbi:SURF1 family protein [Sphingobium sp. AN641]|uniref:SURF1 family protein n=1 Tax=Sphingobium sp. AN641 TaxID=3133443 RepID=UPI0030C42C76